MKIIALESSALTASTAIVDENSMIAEYTVNYKQQHSKTLLSMLDEICRMADVNLADIDGVAVAAGPGSFTGLRIGSATAKGIALVIDKPILEVPTLMGLAANIDDDRALICPIMDARRDRVYNGLYAYENRALVTITDQRALTVAELCEELNARAAADPKEAERCVIFLGDGIAIYRDVIEASLTRPFRFAPGHLARPRAGAVGTIGLQMLKAGQTVPADDHVPVYLQKSQAEKTREEKEAAKLSKTVLA
ncbi:MAG: tRNA (adenosine(37)-N6)-threonylcarbamoyltransferase complex dimerization subunit type 1 TsaB [Lachnospiraceae bacterium]|nr:tRNA (adenosine(37)-N6)-threonylcarbamoyltransferase complex dimerization subunit type 1 TsaB [Lachnospiraceae bacterium]